jgi:hypothetical protein
LTSSANALRGGWFQIRDIAPFGVRGIAMSTNRVLGLGLIGLGAVFACFHNAYTFVTAVYTRARVSFPSRVVHRVSENVGGVKHF